MKHFDCFVCGRSVELREKRAFFGLTCDDCLRILEGMPPAAQKIMSFVFRRLGALEREIHGREKARRRV